MALVVKNLPADAGDMSCGFDPWVKKIPWRRKWQATPVFFFFFFFTFLFFKFYFIFKLYNIVLVLPNIEMNLPQVYVCSPSWPSSLLPPHTLPLGCPSAPAPSIQYRASNLDWWLVSYMILYMFQCHSPKSSHPLSLSQSPKDCLENPRHRGA